MAYSEFFIPIKYFSKNQRNHESTLCYLIQMNYYKHSQLAIFWDNRQQNNHRYEQNPD